MDSKQAGTTCREAGGPMQIGTATFATHLCREVRWMNIATPFTKGMSAHFAAMVTGRHRPQAASLPEPGLAA
jgi:hypothetical protein